MKNKYQEFFNVLKSYLIQLEVDQDRGIMGCSNEEIQSLESRVGKLPTAYKEYLKNIGKNSLATFMDAESMAFVHLDYIEETGQEIFEENQLTIERPHLVISSGRTSEYITLIYFDEGEDPPTWILSEYWNEENSGDNFSIRTDRFTDLMLAFFSNTLKYQRFGFHFVTKEESEDEEIIKKRYMNYFQNLKTIGERIDNHKTTNPLVIKLNNRFLDYYLPEKEYINKELINYENEKKTSINTSNEEQKSNINDDGAEKSSEKNTHFTRSDKARYLIIIAIIFLALLGWKIKEFI